MIDSKINDKINIKGNTAEERVSELQSQWKNLQQQLNLPSFINLRSYRESFNKNPENLEELMNLFKECFESGKLVKKQTERTKLQWLVSEIGDYIFELSGRFFSTSIYYFEEEKESLLDSQENILDSQENLLDSQESLLDSQEKLEQKEIFDVDYPRNSYFTGREEEIKGINDFFSDNSDSEIVYVALTGMGGIGKTQIAIEYAYIYKDKYSAVYWLQADNISMFFYSAVELAEKIIPNQIKGQEDKIIARRLKEHLETQSNCLLILDNADDFDKFKQYLPESGKGHILITTRSPRPNFTLKEVNKIIPIYPFLPQEAELFILRKTKDNFDVQSPHKSELEIISKIANELGMLPLAIDQAGAYIKAEKITFEQYLRDYRDRDKGREIRAIRGKLSAEHLSVSATYILALQTIEQKSPAAAELIRICAFFASKEIPKKIFIEEQNVMIWGDLLIESLKKTAGFYQLLENLTCYSLMSWNEKTQLLSIHRVVQQVIQDEISEEEEIKYIEKVIKAVNGIFPEGFNIRFGERDFLKSCDRLSNQVEKALEWVELKSVKIIEAGYLMNKYSTYLLLRSNYSKGKDVCEKSQILWKELSTVKDLLPEDKKQRNLGFAQSLNNLGLVYFVQDDYCPDDKELNKKIELESMFQEALEIRQENLSENDPDYFLVGQSYHNLARLQTALGKYSEAEKTYKKALEINKSLTNPKFKPLLARNYHAFGQLYALLGRYPEAKTKYNEALEINKKIYGEKHFYVASNLEHLGDISMAESSYNEAEDYYLQALEIKRAYLRQEEHQAIADTYSRLGRLYLELKEPPAEHYYTKALEIRKKVLEPNHSDIASNYNDLAFLYQKQGDYEKAVRFYHDAIKMYKEVYKNLAEEHIIIVSAYNNLANCYYEQGNYKEAEKNYQKVLKLLEQLKSEEVKEIVYSKSNFLNGLALVYQKQGQYTEAEEKFQESLELKRQLLGNEDIEVAYSLNDLALLYQEQERYEEAEPLFQEALKIRRQLLEEEDLIEVAYSLDNLALLYQQQERYEEAEPLFQEALDIRRQLLEEEDLIEVADSLDNLALLYQQQERYEEAEEKFQKSLGLKRQLLEEKDLIEVAYSLDNLALLYQEQEEYEKAEALFQEALDIRRQLVEEEDLIEVAHSLDNLALLYQQQERYEEANILFEEAKQIEEELSLEYYS